MGQKLGEVKKEISAQVFVSRICRKKTRTAELNLERVLAWPPVRRESSSARGAAAAARSKESSVPLFLFLIQCANLVFSM